MNEMLYTSQLQWIRRANRCDIGLVTRIKRIHFAVQNMYSKTIRPCANGYNSGLRLSVKSYYRTTIEYGNVICEITNI